MARHCKIRSLELLEGSTRTQQTAQTKHHLNWQGVNFSLLHLAVALLQRLMLPGRLSGVKVIGKSQQ